MLDRITHLLQMRPRAIIKRIRLTKDPLIIYVKIQPLVYREKWNEVKEHRYMYGLT